MNKVKEYLKQFSEVADDWFKKENWIEDWYTYYNQFFTEESLNKATWEDFQEMGNHIHSFNSMGLAKKRALGRMNISLDAYRSAFKYLVSENDPINVTINNLYKKYNGEYVLPFFSDSAISELAVFAFPDKYIPLNNRDIRAAELLGLDFRKVRGETFGDKFLRFNNLVNNIVEEYIQIVGLRTETTAQLETDQFFSWMYKNAKTITIESMLSDYKLILEETGLKDEKYKWEILRDLKGKPDINADDFMLEVKSLKLKNIPYRLTIPMLSDLAKQDTEYVRSMFIDLYDESKALDDRIKKFMDAANELKDKRDPKLNTYQDERAISSYLALHYPLKYTFYKSKFYEAYCHKTGINAKKAGQKYSHYLSLLSDFVQNYLKKDDEIITLARNELGELADEDPNLLLLGQDIFYQVLEAGRGVNHWIFQGNPKVYDFKKALSENLINDWSVSAHKDVIKTGDKIILWITGEQAGCYGFAEVTSEPYNKEKSIDDNLWKEPRKNSLKVDIKITHNLFSNPVLLEDIKGVKELTKLKVGTQGTNFSATEIEYSTLLRLAEKGDSFENTRSKFDAQDFDLYISYLRKAAAELNIKKGDPRVVFSVGDNLNFTIGQRYSFNLYSSEQKGKIGVISNNKLNPNSKPYEGTPPQPFYTYTDSFTPSEDDWLSVTDAMKNELMKTNKSGFRKHNNIEFEEYVFENLSKPDSKSMNKPRNTILFGPPGTGKTYLLRNHYMPNYTITENSVSRDEYLRNQIQDISWWQVIALAVLDIGKAKVGDIHNHEYVQVKASLSNSTTITPTIWGQLQAHTIDSCQYVNVQKRNPPQIFNKLKGSVWEIINEEVNTQYPELYELQEKIQGYKSSPSTEIRRFDFVTFHQSFSYEDFVEGIKPIIDENENGSISYTIEDGVFKKICNRARNDVSNEYALFIDEINRGNVAAIFGELITLIETDKREGMKNELSVTLPYSKKKFSVPPNLSIFGSMNTADRSVEALDTALRRRFSFTEITPDPGLIKSVGELKDSEGVIEGIDVSFLLKTINRRIEKLFDKDHMIGHSYFLSISTISDLKSVFHHNVMPLLQEYFYGDYGKIGLILGDKFFTKQPLDFDDEFFAEFESYDAGSLLDRPVYHIKNMPEMKDVEFISALKTLLRDSSD